MKKMSIIYDLLLEHHAETVMNEAFLHYARQRLYEQIDHALQCRDKVAFYTLTSRLKSLEHSWLNEA